MKTAKPPARAGTKRSADALQESRPRKREKYARIACTFCKIRKVKCSGNLPCSRCEELQGECIYSEPHPDTQNSNVSPPSTTLDLELSVFRLNTICEQMQHSMGRFASSYLTRPCLQRKHPSDNETPPLKWRTPTDFRYTLNLAQHALKARGLFSAPEYNCSNPSLAGDESGSPDALIALLQAARPVLELGHEKVTQLVAIFKHEIYPLYPCIRLSLAQGLVDTLFALPTRSPHPNPSRLEAIDVEIMKSVVAIALLATGDTQNPLAADLEGQLLWSVDSCYDHDLPQIEDIVMATLLSLYLDLKHRRVKAWRMSGVAARLCLELGIHQEHFFDSTRMHPDRITDYKRLFACVYNADKKNSFYSGLPWTLHDRDIDVFALRLDPQESWLSTMIYLNKNLCETWALINTPSEKNRERGEFLDFQLQKLVNSLPTDFPPLDPSVNSPPWLLSGLKRFCRLRVHYIKLLTYIGSFASITDLISQPQPAKTLITTATEIIDTYLAYTTNTDSGTTNTTTPLLLPSALKFLLSAISFMLLVVAHYPSEYGPLASKPFHTAIDILVNAQGQGQGQINDPGLDISGALQDLRRIADICRLPQPPGGSASGPLPLVSCKPGEGGVHLGQAFATPTPNAFDELQTPDSNMFSMLGGVDVDIAAGDMVYMNDIFG